jgi:hypothetical protein
LFYLTPSAMALPQVRPGGFVVVHTFMLGCEKIGRSV